MEPMRRPEFNDLEPKRLSLLRDLAPGLKMIGFQRRYLQGVLSHVPLQNVSLFDHLVGDGEERWGNLDAQQLCGLQVDDKLEPGRLHDR